MIIRTIIHAYEFEYMHTKMYLCDVRIHTSIFKYMYITFSHNVLLLIKKITRIIIHMYEFEYTCIQIYYCDVRI